MRVAGSSTQLLPTDAPHRGPHHGRVGQGGVLLPVELCKCLSPLAKVMSNAPPLRAEIFKGAAQSGRTLPASTTTGRRPAARLTCARPARLLSQYENRRSMRARFAPGPPAAARQASESSAAHGGEGEVRAHPVGFAGVHAGRPTRRRRQPARRPRSGLAPAPPRRRVAPAARPAAPLAARPPAAT